MRPSTLTATAATAWGLRRQQAMATKTDALTPRRNAMVHAATRCYQRGSRHRLRACELWAGSKGAAQAGNGHPVKGQVGVN
jgi:hypothetical protein